MIRRSSPAPRRRLTVVDLELKSLALPDIRDAGVAEPTECADDGLPLRVQDLGLGHHAHHYPGHANSSSSAELGQFELVGRVNTPYTAEVGRAQRCTDIRRAPGRREPPATVAAGGRRGVVVKRSSLMVLLFGVDQQIEVRHRPGR